jgi:hypothetical protein
MGISGGEKDGEYAYLNVIQAGYIYTMSPV